MIAVKEIDYKATYEIRKAILRKGMTLSHKMAGDENNDSLHLGVFEGDKLHCVGSFMNAKSDLFREAKQYQLRGMASDSGAQGKGFGKLLLQEAERILKKRNVGMIWCNARVTALHFYIKLGYRIKGEEFEVPQVGKHMVLYKYLE